MAVNIPIDIAYQDDNADADSAIGSDSVSDTDSLASAITNYRHENNRTYHAYRDGEYWGPNDEEQNDQLDLAHHLYLLTLDNKLFLAPISKEPQVCHTHYMPLNTGFSEAERSQRVLDVGTGTGIWAMDFGDQFPSASVVGFDLSPIQPHFVPTNVTFEINDAADDWGYTKNSFDFVHVRGMYGSIAHWPAFYEQAYLHLKPGGYIEQVEMSVVPKSDDGTVNEDNIFGQWGEVSLEAGEQFGKTLKIHELAKGYIENAGFEDVVEKVFRWPIGPWSRDPRLKLLGAWNQLHWEAGIEGWCMALLTRVLGWTYTEVQAYLGLMRSGLRDRTIHAYHELNVVYGRKPIGQPSAS